MEKTQTTVTPALIAAAGAVVAALIGVVAALIIAGILPPDHHDPAGTIESPAAGSRISREFTVAGRLSHIPGGDHVWLAVQVGNLLYPKEPEMVASADRFSAQVNEGGSPPGGRLSLVLLRVDGEGQIAVERWLSALRQGREPAGFASVPGAETLDAVANLRLGGQR